MRRPESSAQSRQWHLRILGRRRPATKAQLNEPHSIGLDKAGDLYIADVKNHRIRKVDLKTGTISTFAARVRERQRQTALDSPAHRFMARAPSILIGTEISGSHCARATRF